MLPTHNHVDNLNHIVCCDVNKAMCGSDVTNSPWSEDREDECVVCNDLWDKLPSCGKRFCTLRSFFRGLFRS